MGNNQKTQNIELIDAYRDLINIRYLYEKEMENYRKLYQLLSMDDLIDSACEYAAILEIRGNSTGELYNIVIETINKFKPLKDAS